LAEFYGRGGRVVDLKGEEAGSVTLIGAVSPPGGDFSEPMTQNSLRVTGAFWGLDVDLARRRHFPAINWTMSYSLYKLASWFDQHIAADWTEQGQRARVLLQREGELQEIVQLVGSDALAETEKGDLAIGRIIREDFLQQSNFGEDAFCPPEKSYWMLKVILTFYDKVREALNRAIPLARILEPALLEQIGRMREWPASAAPDHARELLAQIETLFKGLK
jgi:V/A-type H+-transporting ATPase subunit A